jgi:hypothetical protein
MRWSRMERYVISVKWNDIGFENFKMNIIKQASFFEIVLNKLKQCLHDISCIISFNAIFTFQTIFSFIEVNLNLAHMLVPVL